MTTYILYNKQTPAERWATDLAERLKRDQIEPELIDADSPQGAQMAEHYDVMDRPAVLVIREDGSPAEIWQGQDGMPLIADIVYAAHN